MRSNKPKIDPALQTALSATQRRAHKPPSNALAFALALNLPDGKPYTLAGHEDLNAILQDASRVVVVRKAAQKGVTELMLRLQFWLASQNYSSAYFLASRHYVRLQVQRRVEPLIAANKLLQQALIRDENEPDDADARIPAKYRLTDNIAIKRLWGGYLIYMGLQSEADVRAYPLDAIFVDEVETLKPELADALQERLYHSTLKWERWFSQPTAAGFGIDERFQLTNQQHMLFHCARCSHEFTLEESFPHCLSAGSMLLSDLDLPAEPEAPREGWTYCCPKCHTPFQPLNANWRWVAKYPSRPDAGYHLTQLYSATLTANEVAQLYLNALRSPNRMERFHNSILGLPYTGGDRQPIHPDKLLYHTFDAPILNPQNPRYIGVDVGDTLHMVCIENRYITAIEQFTGATKWRDLMNRILALQPKAAAVNAMPYKDSAKDLIRELKKHGIGGAIIYDASDESKPSIGYEDEEFGEPVRRISYPRTELMDGTVSALLRGEILLPPKHKPATALLIKHLMNYITERDEQGRRRYARGREDHLGRALDYARILAQHAFTLQLAAPNYGDPNTWLVKDAVVDAQPL
jgi:hypothetical protein